MGRASASASVGGSLDSGSAIARIGMPSSSRGRMFTGLRTETTGRAPCSCRSMAISPPELPNPTTSTRRSRNRRPLRYSELCRTGPGKRSRPGQDGTTGSSV